MNANIMALRAITAVFFRRLLAVVIGAVALIGVVLYGLVMYLTHAVSGWWSLALLVLIPLTIAAVVIGAGLWIATSKIMPKKLSRDETRQVRTFTTKLFGLLETVKTPYPVKLALIAKDVVRGRESGYLRSAIGDSKSLKDDFARIRDMMG